VITGVDMHSGRRLSDDERSEKLGEVAVGWGLNALTSWLTGPRPSPEVTNPRALSPGGRAGLIKPHGQQPPGRRAAGVESHHPEMQTPLRKAIANYDADEDWTLLMSVQDHRATFKGQAAQRSRPGFLNELGTAGAIGEAADIMTTAGIDSATAAEAALEHAAYLFGTTPADKVQMCLPATK
jgi:hypothetical protein